VLLDPAHDDADAMRQRLLQKLNAAGLDVEIKTWLDLSMFYKQVKNMFDLIFLFLFTIVFIVVLMSITNTMTTSVLERTREIGTLRSLGMKRRKIMELFAVEGAMLGLFGCLLGLVIDTLTTMAVNAANIRYVPPSSSDEVPLRVDFVPDMLLGSLVLLAIVAMLAALLPARRAANTEIVDALGHV
jgi:putative ABC transport system permease protein